MFVISGLDPHLDTSPDTQEEMEVIKVEVVDASDLEPLRVKEETAGVHDVTNTSTVRLYTRQMLAEPAVTTSKAKTATL